MLFRQGKKEPYETGGTSRTSYQVSSYDKGGLIWKAVICTNQEVSR
jgi:hypothetical protein